MEKSPLKQQPRPEAFQPKVVKLYEVVFKDDGDDEDTAREKPEGFWREFFLLKPDSVALRQCLDALTAEDLVHLQERTRQLFQRAIVALKTGEGAAAANALDTLNTFLSAVFAKKYTNTSAELIAILAGLDRVDVVFSDFVSALEQLVRNGRTLDIRSKAIDLALTVISGAYQTSLLSYFIQRDLFPPVIKFIQSAETTDQIIRPFTLIGLLANYNKFEFQNPYQLRLADFINEDMIRNLIRSVGFAAQKLRAQYIHIQDDMPEGWSLASTLGMFGLASIAPGKKPVPTPTYDAETAKKMFAELPGPGAAVLLATYDFAHANKLFCFILVTLAVEPGLEPPLASYISLTSYLMQHAYLSARTTLYLHLNLMVFRLLVEDAVLCKRLCSQECKAIVRLCRQRQPHLPLVRYERVLVTTLMDAMVDGINHNLRRRLDVELYTLLLGILLRIISFLSRSRTRLAYHWAEMFRALLGLVRFLTSYAADFRHHAQIGTLLDHIAALLALGLSSGEAFLPTPAAYDDLFYKVVEMGDVLLRFRDTYDLANRPRNSIKTVLSVYNHYQKMLAEGGRSGAGSLARKAGGSSSSSVLTTLRVAEVIKEGYETLSIQAQEGLDHWERYREADERTLLKKVARTAVADVRGSCGG